MKTCFICVNGNFTGVPLKGICSAKECSIYDTSVAENCPAFSTKKLVENDEFKGRFQTIAINLQETAFWNGNGNCVNGVFAHYQLHRNELTVLVSHKTMVAALKLWVERNHCQTPKVTIVNHFCLTPSSEDQKVFPNGATSYLETFYEVVSALALLENGGKDIINRVERGTGGMYELAEDLTDEFERINKDREWDGEFFDEIYEFVEEKSKGFIVQ